MLNRLFGTLLTLCFLAAAQAQHFTEVKDLEKEWLIYNQSQNLYLPFFQEEPVSTNTIYLKLDARLYEGYYLSLNLPAGTSVLAENEIITYQSRPVSYMWPIDSLSKLYSGNLFLSFFNPDLKHVKNDIRATIMNRVEKQAIVPEHIFPPLYRSTDHFQEFFVIGIIFILLVYIAIRNLYPKTAAFYYNINKAFATTTRDEQTQRMNLLEGNNLMVLVLHSLVVAFVFMIILGYYDIEVRFIHIGQFGETIFTWLKVSGLIFILLVLKYMMIIFLANLFGLNLYANRHFFEYIRLSKIFYGMEIIFLILFILAFQFSTLVTVKFILFTILFFIFLRTIVLFTKFIRTSSFTNLYLFSYLCGTEIIPLLIGFKLLIF